jgi:phospholipid-translocating ATPase
MPVLILGCCDQSVNALRAIHYPQLYKLGIEQRRYNMKRFWIYIIEAIANGAIIFFVFYFIYTYDPLSENGLVSSKQDFSSAVITIVITNAALFVGFNTYAWNWMMHAAVWGTIIVTLAFLAVISNIESADLYGVGSAVYGKASFWLASVIAIIITMLPRYLVTFVKQHFFPEDVDIVREMQKYHLDGISSQRKGTNADEKVPLMRQVQPVGESGSDQDADDSNSPTSIPMTQVDPPVPSPVLTAPHHASTQPSSMSSAPVTQPVSQ